MAKKVTGVVTSSGQDKTIVITVTSRKTHPVYGKKYTVSRKYMAHDEKNEAVNGNIVEIAECRPISKAKTWALTSILEAGHGVVELKDEEELVEKKIKVSPKPVVSDTKEEAKK